MKLSDIKIYMTSSRYMAQEA